MALRQLCAPVQSELRRLAESVFGWLPDNRVVRSAILVAGYTLAFFPLSALPGGAAQFVSIIPVAIIASWLGARAGLIVALGFIPLLAILSVVGQGQQWDYLLHEGRPAALVSLIAMASIAGRAGDLGKRLNEQFGVSDSYLLTMEHLTGDRARLSTLGIELATARTGEDVYLGGQGAKQAHLC